MLYFGLDVKPRSYESMLHTEPIDEPGVSLDWDAFSFLHFPHNLK